CVGVKRPASILRRNSLGLSRSESDTRTRTAHWSCGSEWGGEIHAAQTFGGYDSLSERGTKAGVCGGIGLFFPAPDGDVHLRPHGAPGSTGHSPQSLRTNRAHAARVVP